MSFAEAKSAGYSIVAGHGAVVIVESVLINALNKTKSTNPDLADALAALAGIVDESGNKEAAKAFDHLVEEISGEADKFKIKLYWKHITECLPQVTSISTIVHNITSLFN